MSAIQREYVLLGLVFVGVVIFVWRYIVNDLPDDFLSRISKKDIQEKESDDGRLRDNG